MNGLDDRGSERNRRGFFAAPALALIAMTWIAPGFAADGNSSKDEVTIFPEQAAVISAKEIPQLQTEALQGSADAAHRLATYCGMIRLDDKCRIYWTEIRVENGDQDARYDLGAYLAAEPDPQSHIRARYWLNAVVKSGPPELARNAGYVLKNLDAAPAENARKEP